MGKGNNDHCQCCQHHPLPPLPTQGPLTPIAQEQYESRTLAMANSVRLAGRVVDSIQEQRQLAVVSHNGGGGTIRSYRSTIPMSSSDSASDMSSLPPARMAPYRLLNGPEIENIEGYINKQRKSHNDRADKSPTKDYDYDTASAPSAGRDGGGDVTHTSPAIASSHISMPSPLFSPTYGTSCRTSRDLTPSTNPSGPSTPTTPNSLFSIALKSPTLSSPRRFSTRVAPKKTTPIPKTVHIPSSQRNNMKDNSIHTGGNNLKQEYNCPQDRKQYPLTYAPLRRSRSKLQRMDHGAISIEIRSPNGLANTPCRSTFRSWSRALSSQWPPSSPLPSSPSHCDDSRSYHHHNYEERDNRRETRHVKRWNDPQAIIPRPKKSVVRHPVEIRLDQSEMVVQHIKTFVHDRLALEDRVWHTDMALHEYEAESQDWQRKYEALCQELEQARSVTGRYDKNWVDYKTRNNEFANTVITIDADLSSLFHWNTKQLFVYAIAEYTTPTHNKNQIVMWDTIVKDKSDALIRKRGLRNKYSLIDVNKKWTNVHANVSLHWNIVPYVGFMTYGSSQASEPYAFPLPSGIQK
ncbi:hypothetical protein BGZ94_007568 [Podila epigama]|nr:hypothetical protein BGZ94_007568 [Podila epigama]